jgi:WD40 repeat protein
MQWALQNAAGVG